MIIFSFFKTNQASGFEESLELGKTTKTSDELDDYLSELNKKDFAAGAYDLTQNNCITFSERICEFLLVKFPEKYSVPKIMTKSEKFMTSCLRSSSQDDETNETMSPSQSPTTSIQSNSDSFEKPSTEKFLAKNLPGSKKPELSMIQRFRFAVVRIILPNVDDI